MGALHTDVLRRELAAPGWAYLELGPGTTRASMRAAMRGLAAELSESERRLHERGLEPTALTMFDQGETTPFHVDGGPDESLLMLGYEPTSRASVLRVACLPTCARCTWEPVSLPTPRRTAPQHGPRGRQPPLARGTR
jgi:hypothetical protein